jgi:hypothetical protein
MVNVGVPVLEEEELDCWRLMKVTTLQLDPPETVTVPPVGTIEYCVQPESVSSVTV